MSSSHQFWNHRTSQTPRTPTVGSSADPPTALSPPPSPRRLRAQDLQLHSATGEYAPQADRYVLSRAQNGNASIELSSMFMARHSGSVHPAARKKVAYQFPFQASRALRNLNTSEVTSNYLASLRRRPTNHGNRPSRTHSPTFPYNEYAPLPELPPTYSGIEGRDRAKEVYALSASENPLATDSLTTCGRCLAPLRWDGNLPSRCQVPKCRAVNVGSDWATNERFRQAELSRGQQVTVPESKNYLGEPVNYDKLLQWRKDGAREDQDPVDWQNFVLWDGSESEDEGREREGNCRGKEYLPCSPPLGSCSDTKESMSYPGQNNAMHYQSVARAAELQSDSQHTAALVGAQTHTTTPGADDATEVASSDLPIDVSGSHFDIPTDLMNDLIINLDGFANKSPQLLCHHYPSSPLQQQQQQGQHEQAKSHSPINATDVSPNNNASFLFGFSQHSLNSHTCALDLLDKTQNNNNNPYETPLRPSPSPPSICSGVTTSTRSPSPALFTATAAAAAAAPHRLANDMELPGLGRPFAQDGRARLIPSTNVTTTTTPTTDIIPTTTYLTPAPDTSLINSAAATSPQNQSSPRHSLHQHFDLDRGTGRAEDEVRRLFSKRRRGGMEKRLDTDRPATAAAAASSADASPSPSSNINRPNRVIRRRLRRRGVTATITPQVLPTSNATPPLSSIATTTTTTTTTSDPNIFDDHHHTDDTDTTTTEMEIDRASPLSSCAVSEADHDDSGDFMLPSSGTGRGGKRKRVNAEVKWQRSEETKSGI